MLTRYAASLMRHQRTLTTLDLHGDSVFSHPAQHSYTDRHRSSLPIASQLVPLGPGSQARSSSAMSHISRSLSRITIAPNYPDTTRVFLCFSLDPGGFIRPDA